MVTAKNLAYMYQLQGMDYSKLYGTSFTTAVIDPDDAHLSSTQVSTLTSMGKNVISYLSIGEAENYRDYWQTSWNTSKPSFVLQENPDWPGNYEVKFWDATWQKIILDKVVALAQAGYTGVCLDVVDCYSVPEVAAAYTGPGTARDAMMQFVGKIADAAHAINANFKIIQNNALDLLTVNPDDPNSATNTAYLSKIDAVNAESTFYVGSQHTTWENWNVDYLKHAVDAGKTVYAMDYVTGTTAQTDFINKAIADHFVPYIAGSALNSVLDINYDISAKLLTTTIDTTLGITPITTTPQPVYNAIDGTARADNLAGSISDDLMHGKAGADTLHGDAGNDVLYGDDGNDSLYGDGGNDILFGGAGNDKFFFYSGAGKDVIMDFQGAGATGGDTLYISKFVYTTKAQVLQHTTYDHGNAVIDLGNGNSVTLIGVPDHALNSGDIQLF